jgi:hypothetical protein
MRLHGFLGDEWSIRDRDVGAAFGHEPENLALPG